MLMLLAVSVPLLLAGLIAALSTAHPARGTFRWRRTLVVSAPLAVIPAAALTLAPGAADAPRWEAEWLLLGTVMVMDSTARALIAVTALLCGAALTTLTWIKLRSGTTTSGDAGEGAAETGSLPALCVFFLVCFSGVVTTYAAADIVTFYLGFAVMSFAAAGLVVHYRSAASHRATRIYLVMSVISETALLAGFLLVSASGATMMHEVPAAVASSSYSGLLVGLFILGFGIKAGTVPLHVWLPLAHPAAPPAASALLSGVLVKAGLVGWLRCLIPDPSGTADVDLQSATALSTGGWVLMILALTGAFAAVMAGVFQDDPKVVLAYSTISQMGFMTVLIASAMILPELAEPVTAATVLYAVHHGLAKGVLFLGVPVVKAYGRGGTGVFVGVGLSGAALAVAGAPLTSGAYGKYLTKEAVDSISLAGVGVDHLLPWVAVGSTVLMMRFAAIMWRTSVEPRSVDAELVSWLVICAAGVSLPWLIGTWWIPQADGFSWEASALWEASWPIVAGLSIGALTWWAASRGWLPEWVRADGTLVAPGDVVVAEESVAHLGGHHVQQGLTAVHQRTAVIGEQATTLAANVSACVQWLVRTGDRAVAPWPGSGAVIVLLLTLTAVTVWLWAGEW